MPHPALVDSAARPAARRGKRLYDLQGAFASPLVVGRPGACVPLLERFLKNVVADLGAAAAGTIIRQRRHSGATG
jgi:hypothetical protein